MDVKADPSFCCIQETYFNIKERYYLMVKNWKRYFKQIEPEKQAGVALLRSSKIKLKPKIIKRDMNDMTYSSKKKFTMMF